jgi:hypothetical protein
MSPPIVFKDVAPVVPVRDLQVALERYRQLGFEVRAYGHGTGYGYAQRGAVSIHLTIRRVFPVHTGFFLFINLRVTDGRVGKKAHDNE